MKNIVQSPYYLRILYEQFTSFRFLQLTIQESDSIWAYLYKNISVCDNCLGQDDYRAIIIKARQ